MDLDTIVKKNASFSNENLDRNFRSGEMKKFSK